MRDLLLVLILPFLIYASFRKSFIALGLWLWTSAFNLNQLIYGFASVVPFSKLFAGITILSFLFSKEKTPIKIEGITILIMLFFFIATLSNLSAIGDMTIAWERWSIYFKIILFYFFAIAIINKKIHFDFLIWMLLLSIGALAATEGVKFLVSGGNHRIYSLIGIAGDNNFFGVMIVTLIPLSFYIFTQTQNKILKMGIIALIVFMILGILATYSRGAIIGLSVLGFFFWRKSEKKIIWLILFAIVAISIMYVMPETWMSRMDTIDSADTDSSFLGRVIAWKLATLIAMDNLLGGGFNAIENFNVWQQYSLDFYKLDFIPTPFPDEEKAHSSHSIYFQVLGNHGFLGLLLFLGVLLTVFLKLSRIQKRVKNEHTGTWINVLSNMLMVSLVTYCVAGAAVNVAYFDFIYLIFAFTVALDKLTEDSNKTIQAFT